MFGGCEDYKNKVTNIFGLENFNESTNSAPKLYYLNKYLYFQICNNLVFHFQFCSNLIPTIKKSKSNINFYYIT